MAKQEFRREFTVNPPLAYGSFAPTPAMAEAELEKLTADVRKIAAIPKEKPKPGKKRAVWIAHGMGQQIPFATLDQVAEGLIKAAERPGSGVQSPDVKYRVIKVDKTVLQRVEMTFPRTTKDESVEVDLFECYWAPKTEGVVSLKEVISFLWDGGTRGLLNSIKPFQRALFGGMESYSLTWWKTPTYLLFTLALLASLTVINSVVVATAAARAEVANAQKLITSAILEPLTAVASMVCLMAITFGVALFLASLSRPRRVQTICWVFVALTGLAILAGAGMMAVMVGLKWVPAWMTPAFQANIHGLTNTLVLSAIAVAILAMINRRRGSSQNESLEQMRPRLLFYAACLIFLAGLAGMVWLGVAGACLGDPAASLSSARLWQRVLFSSFWIWPFLILISGEVRELLVQYVGDVTAYISSYKIDRFEAVRQKIKDLACESATAVYRAKAAGADQTEYGKVAIVGHSLGSVIAYDTLNRLLNEDGLSNQWLQVVDRTCLFLTFGSPLDKIAFFFSIMGKTTRHVREQLAAVVQPLIQDEACRLSIPWVNVFSKNDIICGDLDFYDPAKNSPNPPRKIKPVENVPDPDALIPLLAHVEYWNNRTVWDRVLAAIIA